MKNTDKEIIERFQKFDFDPDEKNQKQIFNKITLPVVKRNHKRLAFAFVAVFSVLIAVVLVNNNEEPIGKSDIETQVLTENAVEPDIQRFAGEATVQEQEIMAVSYDAKTYKGADGVSDAMVEELSIAQKSEGGNYADRKVALPEAASAKPAVNMQMKEVKLKAKGSARRGAAMAPMPMEAGENMRMTDERRGGDKYYNMEANISASLGTDYNSIQDESYKKYEENSFRSTASDPLSTFSADVDVAAYNIVRRIIMSGNKPNPDIVRIEEFLNYFDYTYPQPKGSDPVSMNFEYTDSPWNKGLKLVKIGVKAKDIEKANLPPGNLVFLIDISGSMAQENRLPLVKKSLKMLVDELRPEDKVSIVTYANGVNEVLSGAKGSEKEKIKNIIDSLNAAGGTNGSEGLSMAYEAAKKNFIRKGNNRIILATDGDFNIGPRSESELENQITAARESGVFLSVLGYGMGNYKDSKVQTLANKGNGNYAYINDLFEAQKVLVKEFGATLFTVAKDVKLQVEFNPAFVTAYRLVGYEKRALNTQDFNDDTKDAGEMGAGHTVTVIYEIIPAGVESKFLPDVEALKYAKSAPAADNGEVLTLKLRYKDPDSDTSKLMERQLRQKDYVPFNKASDDMRFAASVAQFGQILKKSQYGGDMTIDEVISTAKKAKGADDEGYRADFIKMLEMYKIIK